MSKVGSMFFSTAIGGHGIKCQVAGSQIFQGYYSQYIFISSKKVTTLKEDILPRLCPIYKLFKNFCRQDHKGLKKYLNDFTALPKIFKTK